MRGVGNVQKFSQLSLHTLYIAYVTRSECLSMQRVVVRPIPSID